METIIRWRHSAYANFVDLIRSMATTPATVGPFVRFFTDYAERTLELHRGPPPEATRWEKWLPPVYSWELLAGRIWLVIVVRERGGFWSRLWGRRTRAITIVGAYPQEPSQNTRGLVQS